MLSLESLHFFCKLYTQDPRQGMSSFPCVLAFVRALLFVGAHLGTRVSIFMQVYFGEGSCMHAWVQQRVSVRLSVCEQLTFVSDEVSAEDDEQAEKDEDDNRHHASNHGMVHSRGGRHGRGVLKR